MPQFQNLTLLQGYIIFIIRMGQGSSTALYDEIQSMTPAQVAAQVETLGVKYHKYSLTVVANQISGKDIILATDEEYDALFKSIGVARQAQRRLIRNHFQGIAVNPESAKSRFFGQY